MKKIGICIGISFLFFSCSSPNEKPQEEIVQENLSINQTVSVDEKYTEVMERVLLAEERGAFDSNREYHKEQCGDIIYYDLGSSMDGPTYYIDTKNKIVLAQGGDCRLEGICFGETPPREWTCNK